MSEWYEIPEEKRSDDQNEACRLAYVGCLLRNKEVYADILRRARENDGNVASEVSAFAVLYLDRFLRKTRKLCGPVDVMAVLRADASAAAMGPEIKGIQVEQMDGIATDA